MIDTNNLSVTFFFRKPRSGAFSIEHLFQNIQMSFGSQISYTNQVLSYDTKGIKNRFYLILEAYKKRGKINHVTGDINFITLLLPKSKNILTIHDIESLSRPNRISNFILKLFWLKLPLARVKFVTVVSESTKKRLLEVLPCKSEKIVVIPNVISPLFYFIPKSKTFDKPVVLQIGTKYNKNLERIIEALNNINCLFIIVGALTILQKQLLEEFGIDYENHVSVSEDRLKDLYIKSDIVTFVSLFEGFGMPIVEAQAIGRPVITSNRSSMPEIAGNGALFVDPENVADIRNTIQELLQNEELQKDLVTKGLQNSKRFNTKIIAQQYLDLYRRM